MIPKPLIRAARIVSATPHRMWLPALLLFALLAPAARPLFAMPYDGQCNLIFHADSTLHDFSGTALCEPFEARFERKGGLKLLTPVTVEVPVSGMDTGINRRDKQMRNMFDSERWPLIRATLRPEDINPKLGDQVPESLESVIEVQIRDITHRIPARFSEITLRKETLSFRLQFDLSLEAYELDPPSVLGFIRVDDRVELDVSVALVALPE